MIDQTALRSAFSDYADALLGRYEVGDVLYRLTDQVIEVLGLDGAGVALLSPEDGLRLVTASGLLVSRIEHEQIDRDEGPCHDAAHTNRLVVATDLEADDRWPRYIEVAVAAGYRAVAGIPMSVGDRAIGALNLYSAEPRAWEAHDLDVAQLLANVATGYIVHADALARSQTLTAQLQQALDSRVVIEQAKGILAERHGVDVSVAFDRLRRHARRTSTRLHEICRRVVAGELDV